MESIFLPFHHGLEFALTVGAIAKLIHAEALKALSYSSLETSDVHVNKPGDDRPQRARVQSS